jgi:hypothetical protein
LATKPPTLTPDLSKRARRQLGLSQADAIKASGIQAYKLKQWEGRGLSIELADIRKLTDFYESQGVDIAELAAHASQEHRSPAGVFGQALQDGFTYTPRPGFMISDQLAAELVDKLMERMEANDDRIGELTAAAFQAGFLGGISEDTEAKARELVGALAENHVIFRFLQGRNVIAPTRDEPKTLGNFLAQWMQDSPALPLIAGADDLPVRADQAARTARALPTPAVAE